MRQLTLDGGGIGEQAINRVMARKIAKIP